MSDFYQQSSDQQIECLTQLAREALPLWGLSQAAELTLLKYRENAVYRVVDGGDQYALRIHRFGYHSQAELQSELDWMQALNDSGVMTPAIIKTTDGQLVKNVRVDDVPEARMVDVLGWVEGKPLGSIEEGARGDHDTIIANYRTVGSLMAKLHSHAQVWDRPAEFKRQMWDVDGLLGETPVWGRFWELPLLTEAQRAQIQIARKQAYRELQSLGQDPAYYGLIHCDFLPENLLRGDKGLHLIDFDDAGFGWHLFDIATTLFFHVGEDYFDDLFDAFIAGYRAERALDDQHLSHLPLFLAVRAMVYLGWVYTRSEIEGVNEMAPVLIDAAMALTRQYLKPCSTILITGESR
ncbi:phosphotransferase [Maricurvus nonylphenolicus]|uniref:phosphotransferase enzyme family protein n=1 Tax=Maricurvus nonylphenolicus TaxID=1008307 RepID=UPI0036F2518B